MDEFVIEVNKSETQRIIEHLAQYHPEELRSKDITGIHGFCLDLNAGNPLGNKPICSQKQIHECPECFACEAGNILLRAYRSCL